MCIKVGNGHGGASVVPAGTCSHVLGKYMSKFVYTTASVTCDWARAVMRKPLAKF